MFTPILVFFAFIFINFVSILAITSYSFFGFLYVLDTVRQRLFSIMA